MSRRTPLLVPSSFVSVNSIMPALGVDESNHGRDKEVYVGIRSFSSEDLEPRYTFVRTQKHGLMVRGAISLKKTYHYKEWDDADFVYTLISGDDRAQLISEGFSVDDSIRTRVISAFVKRFGGVSTLVVDGSLNNRVIIGMHEFIPQNMFPEIVAPIPDGDRIYPLVSSAHFLAGALYRHYASGATTDVYTERKINFRDLM